MMYADCGKPAMSAAGLCGLQTCAVCYPAPKALAMTPTNNQEALLPCRHCGAPGYLISDRVRGSFKVKCTGCEMQTPAREVRGDCVAIWNCTLPTSGEAEPVAVVGKDWQLLWASPDSLKAIVDRTGIKIGSLLYTTQPDARADAVQELAEAARAMWPSNMATIPCKMADDFVLPMDVTAGELRRLRTALDTLREGK